MSASEIAAAIALTRLGLGARPGEIGRIASDPRGWAIAQIRPEGAPQPQGPFQGSDERMTELLAYQASDRAEPRVESTAGAPRTRPAAGEADPAAEARLMERRAARRKLGETREAEFLARAQLGATTDQGFAERWALFWSNAITVSSTKFNAGVFIGPYEREAIRPHVFGKFEDLVLAAEQHPAMLFYLDQVRSIGPDSPVGGRRRAAGLNENLAREMMELHTVGAGSGYGQADVAQLARALTGWSVPMARDLHADGRRPGANAFVHGPNGFVFRPNVHEPGARVVMGKTYPPAGLAQGQAILRDLARHPATARRLARRIAAHFVADDPSPALVDRLERTWTASGGDLAKVARSLIEAEETWSSPPVKMKTPYEFIVSTHRALGSRPDRLPALRSALTDLGQPMFEPPSPEGWPDTAADWAGPNAVVKRLNWAKRAADLARAEDPVAVAVDALGARLNDRTRLAVTRAESRSEALTLFLMSPEFQRR